MNCPLKQSEFDLLARKFVAGFQDGHTYVDTDFESEAFVSYVKQGDKLFPQAPAACAFGAEREEPQRHGDTERHRGMGHEDEGAREHKE